MATGQDKQAEIVAACEERIPEYVAGRVASNIRLALAALAKQAADGGKPTLRVTVALDLEQWPSGAVRATADVSWRAAVATKDEGAPLDIDPAQVALPGIAEEGEK